MELRCKGNYIRVYKLCNLFILKHDLCKSSGNSTIPGTFSHCGPSEAGDCSHPLPKMETAENPTPCEAAFNHVAGHGSLRYLARQQVSDRANLWCSNVWSPCIRMAQRRTRIFRREAGDLIERGGWLRVQRRVTQTSDSIFADWC